MKKPITKLLTILTVMALLFSFVACGGKEPSKREEAIAKLNEVSAKFNEVAILVNENAAIMPEEVITTCQEMSALLTQYGVDVKAEDATDEDFDNMMTWFAQVEEWVVPAKADVEARIAAAGGEAGGKKAEAQTAANAAALAYNELATFANENAEYIDQEVLDKIAGYGALIETTNAGLVEKELTDSEYDELIAAMQELEGVCVNDLATLQELLYSEE